ncbi:hypothetical protein HDU97_010434 [Phlyctochytrium planicorne]|nr:hypothetical protein HDU97_010434 [Phlyctochytrium planicorne]
MLAASDDTIPPPYESGASITDILSPPSLIPLWSLYAQQAYAEPSRAKFDAFGIYTLPFLLQPFALADLKTLETQKDAPVPIKELRDEYVNIVQTIKKLRPAQERHAELVKRIHDLNIELLEEMQHLEDLKSKEEMETKKFNIIESGKGIRSFAAKITGNFEKLKMKENATVERLTEAVSVKKVLVYERKEELKDKREELERLEREPIKQLESARLHLLRIIATPFSTAASNDPVLSLDSNHVAYLETQLFPLHNSIKRDLTAYKTAYNSAEAFLAHVKQARRIYYTAWSSVIEENDSPLYERSTLLVGSRETKKILAQDAAPSIAEAERCVGGIYKQIVDFVAQGPTRVKDVQGFLKDPFKPVADGFRTPPGNVLMLAYDRMETLVKVTEKNILPTLAKQVESIQSAFGSIEDATNNIKRDILVFRLSLFDGIVGPNWKNISLHELNELATAWQ